MAISTATLKYLIGISSEISSNVFYFDEQTILYPCGCYSVFFNTEQKTMRLLLASAKGTEITAMDLSPKHKYLAVALKSEKPSINILDSFTSRKQRTLVCKELDSCTIVSLSFSSNSRYIVAICDDPSRTLLYWSWKISKLLLSTKITVSLVPETLYHVSFNPQNYFNVYVFGNKFLKLLCFAGKYHKLYNFPKIEPQDFKCFCWDANQRLLVGTNTGRVLVIEDMDLRVDFNVFQYIKFSNKSVRSQGVTAIASYSKGVITACGTKHVQVFERVVSRDHYRFVRNVWLPSEALENRDLCDQIIQCMVVNPSNNLLVISTNMKQLYSTPINTSDTKYMNQSNVFDILVQPFHYKPITGCCVCSWKPLVATSSLDGSIKLWNYKTFSLEFSKDFSEEVYSISMHPMGLFLLAGFSDKLRFMYILKDDIKPFKEFNIRMCTHCNFSRGGHMFAAVNNNIIQIYSSTTFLKLTSLKGHDCHVQTTTWYMDEDKLISCDSHGLVYEWNVKTGKRISQCVLNSYSFNDIAVNSEKKIYVVGSDYSLKEIYESNILRTFQSGDVLFTSVVMSWSNTILFVGTKNGYIRSMEYPLMLNGKYFDYPCHSLETTHVIFTSDDRYLISTSKDASIAIWKANESESWNSKRDIWPEEVLIPMNDLQKKMCLSAKLKASVNTLCRENEYQMHLKDMSYKDKIKNITEKYNEEIENFQKENEILENDKVKEKSRHDKEMKEIIERHDKEIECLNSANDRKLLNEYEKLKYLHNEIMKLHEEYELQVQEMVEKEELEEQQLINQYEEKLEKLSMEICQYREDILMRQKELDKSLKQIEDDVDMEFLATQTEYEKQLYVEKHANSETKDKNNILKKKLLGFPKELKESEDECEKNKMEVKRLNIIKSNLERDIVIWKNVLGIQSQGLSNEDKRFCDLKLKNHDIEVLQCELENNNTVELRRQMEVKEAAIDNMKKQIIAMQSELEHFTHQFIVMGHTTAETKEKSAATAQELDKVRTVLRKKTDLLDRFCTDLINCTSFIQDPQRLKNCIKSLYERYIQKNVDNIVVKDPDVQVERSRQRNHYEYTIHKVKHKLSRTTNVVARQTQILINKTNNLGEMLQMSRETNQRLLSIAEGTK